MRKLNGITINGEFLGNGVVINGMFRAICTISPVIMREFVTIINKIEILDDAVRISNFNCDNNENRMDIEFENKKSKGVASLFFKLFNGEPELIDCKLILNDNELSTIEEKKPISADSGKVSLDEKLKKLKKLQELKEAKNKQLQKNKLSPLDKTKSHVPISNKSTTQPTTKEQKLKELLEKKRKLQEAKNINPDNISASEVSDSTQADSMTALKDGITNPSGESAMSPDDDSGGKSNESANKTGSKLSSTDTSMSESSDMLIGEDGIIENVDGSQADKYDSAAEDYFADLTDEDLENMSLEELEMLEAQLAAQDDSEEYYDSNQSQYDFAQSQYEFAEKLTQGLAEGISNGLSKGLAEGLSQGLSQGLQSIQGMNQYQPPTGYNPSYETPLNNNFGNQSFAPPPSNNYSIPESFDIPKDSGFESPKDDIEDRTQFTTPPPPVQEFNNIDNQIPRAPMPVQNYYSYDENADMDDLSDIYANFYDVSANIPVSQADGTQTELQNLQAKLQALNEIDIRKNPMTLDEYMAQQKAIQEAKEKIHKRKFRIVGSGGRVNAKALQDGVYVSGKKVYKWGDTRHLEE